MSKIKIHQLKPNNSHLKELSDLETASIIGGYDREEGESSQDIIQKAMEEAVLRRDILLNGNRAQNKWSNIEN